MKPRLDQKRKYNAVYRLKQKIGKPAIPHRSRSIHPGPEREPDKIAEHPEAKILISEYGFIIKPELF